MKKYEYIEFLVDGNLIEFLNKKGKDGWELCQYFHEKEMLPVTDKTRFPEYKIHESVLMKREIDG